MVPDRRKWRLRGNLVANAQMFYAEVSLRSLTPGSDKIVVQPGADYRTSHGNETTSPLFYYLGAGFHGDALDDFGNEATDHFFFQQFAADVDTGGSGRSNPEFSNLFISVVLESIKKAE